MGYLRTRTDQSDRFERFGRVVATMNSSGRWTGDRGAWSAQEDDSCPEESHVTAAGRRAVDDVGQWTDKRLFRLVSSTVCVCVQVCVGVCVFVCEFVCVCVCTGLEFRRAVRALAIECGAVRARQDAMDSGPAAFTLLSSHTESRSGQTPPVLLAGFACPAVAASYLRQAVRKRGGRRRRRRSRLVDKSENEIRRATSGRVKVELHI